MDLKFHFMLMNDHFSIQILSEPSFTVFPQDSGSVETLKILPDILQTILQKFFPQANDVQTLTQMFLLIFDKCTV